ncbi:MAG: ABC transporter permease [Phycisphaeraceae bacterium]|nr:MAG: ABC transporter permease [Phycisphaeraceae bacterium]
MSLVRLVVQTVLTALGQIWVNKVRALLTTLGIVIGVTAVVTTVAATKGLESFVLREFETVGANKVWIFPRMPPGQRDRFSWRQVRLTPEQVEGIMPNAPSLLRLSPVMEMNGDVRFGERTLEAVTVQGIRPEWHEIEQRFVTVGRPFMAGDEESRLNVCLINDKGLEELSLDADPTGEVLLVGGRRFTVVGVVETKSVSPMFGGGEARTEIYVPYATALTMRPVPRMFAVAQSRGPDKVEDVKAEVGGYLRRVRGLQPGDPDTFGVEAIDQFINQFKRISGGLTAAAAGIVAISLIVGGVGIMNIMLVSVSERTREIGLRKALGARPEVILIQFLVEAVTLCMVGGAIGLVIGRGLVAGIQAIPGGSMSGAEVPVWAVWLAVGFCVTTGVVFGMFPAVKAARLNPIDALRHE